MSKDFDSSYFIRPEATLYDEITPYGIAIQTLQIDNHQATIEYGLPIEGLLTRKDGYTIADIFETGDEFDVGEHIFHAAIDALEERVSEESLGQFIISIVSNDNVTYAICNPTHTPYEIAMQEEIKLQRALKGSYLK